MKNEVKDTIEILAANGTAIGFSITDCNEYKAVSYTLGTLQSDLTQ